ncbi:DoxX family protein [Simkania negevensis]|uniref:DoxX family protein n=1 Tax=Simkania negevensis TaxID=83561 RepID=A0ABS3AUV3_9BACT|nr:DoxX family protein [Simkania negevensis]
MSHAQKIVFFIGRVVVGACFFFGGLGKILSWSYCLEYLGKTAIGQWNTSLLASLLTVSIVIEIAGGLAIFLGMWTRTSAIILLILVFLVAIFLQPYWSLSSESLVVGYFLFLVDIIACCALLFIAALGGGLLSFDEKRK